MVVEYVFIGLGIYFVISLVFKSVYRTFWGIDELLQRLDAIVYRHEALEKITQGLKINQKSTESEYLKRELYAVQEDKAATVYPESLAEVSNLSMTGFRIADWGTPIEGIRIKLQLNVSYKTTQPLIDEFSDPNDTINWNGIDVESIRYGFPDGLYQWSELTLKPDKMTEAISKLKSMYGDPQVFKASVDYWLGKSSIIAFKHHDGSITSTTNLLIINKVAFMKNEAHLLERVLSI